MSEKVYALLLGLFPMHFRETHGEDALQLFRDRVRDETGFLLRLRLWLDLLTDLAVSLPLEYRRAQPEMAGAPAQRRLRGMPGFNVLEPEAPGIRAQFFGGLLSLAAFAAIPVLISHGGNHLPPGTFAPPAKHRTGMQVPAAGLAHFQPVSEVISGHGGMHIELVSLSGASGLFQTSAAEPKPEDATAAIMEAFNTHKIVMFGETHANKQEYEWLCNLVSTPAFDDRVDDIVVEFGNSLYQKSVDGYIAGEDVPLEQVEKAWRNVIGGVGPTSPVYEQFYKAVRAANMKRRGKHQVRILLRDPYGDWEKIKDAEDLGPYLAHREDWYTQVVKDEVLAKGHRALLIMGSGHFMRRTGPGLIERSIRSAGGNPYLVVFGTNVVGRYDDLDKRFESWPVPAIVSLAGNWVGDLPAMPVISGGFAPASTLKLGDAADALLYLGSRDALTQLRMPQSELDGTPYGAEIARRLTIQMGHPVNLVYGQTEVPQFPRPLARPPAPATSQSGTQPQPGAASRPPLPPMPKSMNDPLPPRPPSQ